MNALQGNLIAPITIVIVVLASIGLFFLILTRLSLVYQANSSKSDPDTAHIYWIYKKSVFYQVDRQDVCRFEHIVVSVQQAGQLRGKAPEPIIERQKDIAGFLCVRQRV